MPNLPDVTTTVSDTAGALASGTDVCCVWAPCVGALLADPSSMRPTFYGKASSIVADHGYSEGAEYAAFHFAETGRPVLFCPLPIATPGIVSRVDMSGNTGTAIVRVSAGADGVLGEHEGYVEVEKGGTVGVDQIILLVSLDGGRRKDRVRLGTGTSFTPGFIGVTLAIDPGTLVAGDVVLTWFGSAPRSDASGWAAARTALAQNLKFFRSIILCGDVQNASEANAFLGELNTLESQSKRFTYGRASVRDRGPLAKKSRVRERMTGSPSITFAAAGNTATRGTGSWVTDGFQVGDWALITGSTSNNSMRKVTAVTATVLTLAGAALTNETTSAASVVGSPSISFGFPSAGVITRSRGSYLDEGFKVGDPILIAGSAVPGNNIATSITALTATAMTTAATFTADDLMSVSVSIVGTQSKAAWMSALDAAFETVNGFRILLGSGRGRKSSPLTQWSFRRSPQWASNLREYAPGDQSHRTTWEKGRGVTGWDLNDLDQNLVEWDDRKDVDGAAATAARFVSFRTWGNGPAGAFIAYDVTRAADGSLLIHRNNVSVTDEAMTIVQNGAENAAVGAILVLNKNGTATKGALSVIEGKINDGLAALLVDRGFSPHSSFAQWRADPSTNFSVAEPIMVGVLTLRLNGIVHSVETTTRILSGSGV